MELTLTDPDGTRTAHEERDVTVSVEGNGVLIGLENGCQSDLTPFSEKHRSTMEGRLIAYVRRTGEGSITLTASAEGIPAASIELA